MAWVGSDGWTSSAGVPDGSVMRIPTVYRAGWTARVGDRSRYEWWHGRTLPDRRRDNGAVQGPRLRRVVISLCVAVLSAGLVGGCVGRPGGNDTEKKPGEQNPARNGPPYGS